MSVGSPGEPRSYIIYLITSSFFSVGNKCNCTIGSRSIGHLVGSTSLNILTELLVN